MKHSTKYALFFGGILLCVTITSLLVMTKTCSRLTCISFPGKDAWKQKEMYEQSRKTYRALYTKDNELLRVETYRDMDPTDAKNLTTAKMMQVRGLFETAVSPYPGLLSNKITCENTYMPEPTRIRTTTTELTSWIGYLNNRLQYGSCIDTQITYTAFVILFYCPNHATWYQIEHIVPRTSDSHISFDADVLRNMACKSRLESLFDTIIH